MEKETLFDTFLDSEESEKIFESMQSAIKSAFLAGYEAAKTE